MPFDSMFQPTPTPSPESREVTLYGILERLARLETVQRLSGNGHTIEGRVRTLEADLQQRHRVVNWFWGIISSLLVALLIATGTQLVKTWGKVNELTWQMQYILKQMPAPPEDRPPTRR